MIGLVLAAGRGGRFSHRKTPKPLLPVSGVPLIERVLTRMAEGGVDSFIVVVGYEGRQVANLLDSLSREMRISVRTVFNSRWIEGSARSFLAARSYVSRPFLLLMGDHIHEPSSLRRLIAGGLGGDAVRLAVDHRIPASESGLREATKVRLKQDRIIRIGKNISRFDAIDTGAFLCTPELFDAVERGCEQGEATMSGGVGLMANRGKAGAFDIGEARWFDVDTESDLESAEAAT